MGRPSDDAGMTMIEVIVSLVVLAVGILGLAGAAGLAGDQARQGAEVERVAMAAQEALSVVLADGFDNLTAGTDTIAGVHLAWTIQGTSPKVVFLVASRQLASGGMRPDTFVTRVHEWN